MNKIIYIFLFLTLCSCGTKNELRYFNGHVEDLRSKNSYIGTFKRVESKNVLLEFYSFTGGFPIPTFGGYSLFVEGPPSSFQPKTDMEIPNKNVTLTYYHDYHHIGNLEKNFVGHIKIYDVTDKYIFAAIDVTNTDTGKRFEIKGKFNRTPIAKYSKVER